MATGTSDEAVTPSGKPAKAGRDNKASKDGKKVKDDTGVGFVGDGKNGALLRQMASELANVSANLHRLQTDVDALKSGSEPPAAPGKKRPKPSSAGTSASSGSGDFLAALTDNPGTIITLVIPSATTNEGADTAFVCTPDENALTAVDTAQVAKLGYAFSSIPKVALIRMLLQNGEQTAAQLGDGAGLTTGSLYHHLRELVHAEVAHQSSRNRYALTDLGRRATLVLLALQS